MRKLLFNKHPMLAIGLLLWASQSWAGPCWPGAAHPEGDSCASALSTAETLLNDTLAQVETMNSGERLSRLLTPELLITPTVLAEAESALRTVAAKRAQCQPDGWRPGDGVKLN